MQNGPTTMLKNEVGKTNKEVTAGVVGATQGLSGDPETFK